MKVDKENIAVPFEKYEVQGTEKTAWRTVGELVTFTKEDGSISKIVKLWNMPGITMSVFPVKEKKETKKSKEDVPTINVEEEVNVDNIPF